MAIETKKEKEEEKAKPVFSPEKELSEEDLEDFQFILKRIEELKDFREDHYGVKLDKLWSDADKDYIPHKLKLKGRRAIAVDEDKGWRGQLIDLGASNWQSDISQPNPYVKIQIALAILIDQNPTGVFTAVSKRYQATTELIRQLYQRSWEFAQSKQQLKLFVFNLAKYGWGCSRTYPLRITRKVRVIKEYDQENPDKSKYDEKEVTEYNDIFRENLDPRNTWMDDMAKPNNPFSIRDWCWRKVYSFDSAKEEFGKYDFWKYVQKGGVTAETITGKAQSGKKLKDKDLVEIYFYENRLKDIFSVIINGVPVILDPLPISDASGNKKLSLWQGYWNLRHAESPYGIGIYEAMRNDQSLLDTVRNMTIDQLVLSIYKMFFYQSTGTLQETGDIVIEPGKGKQVLNPKDINWLNVPGPGAEAWKGLEIFKKDLDDVSGIGDPLLGAVTGKTAFEIAQAKEAALKRLRTPLDNILDALVQEGYITVSLIQLLYSIPETYKVTDQAKIDAYLNEIQSDPDLYERDEAGNFTAKVFREFPLNLDKDEKGNLIETKDTRFFRVKPSGLKWEGIMNIKPQSVLTPSKQVDKALELEMYNMLIPLIGKGSPEVFNKIAKNIVKLYDKDPKDILPDNWFQEAPQQAQQGEEPLFVPAGTSPNAPQSPTGPVSLQSGQMGQEAQKLTSGTQLPTNPSGLGQRIVSRLTKPFRKV